MFEKYVSVKGAAKILEITPMRVYQIMQEGKLTAIKSPLGILFSKLEVERLKKRREEKACEKTV